MEENYIYLMEHFTYFEDDETVEDYACVYSSFELVRNAIIHDIDAIYGEYETIEIIWKLKDNPVKYNTPLGSVFVKENRWCNPGEFKVTKLKVINSPNIYH